MAHETIEHVVVPNFEIIWTNENRATQLWAKEDGKFLLCHMGKWASGILFCPPTFLLQYKCIESF